MKYTIDYGFGEATLYTPYDAKERFYALANTCFGIRKSIMHCVILKAEDIPCEDFERLEFGGDVYVWREDGARKMVAPLWAADKEWDMDNCEMVRYKPKEADNGKEYIDREEALSAIKQSFEKGERPSLYIKCIPAADVAVVRHGKWRFGKDLPDSFGSINKNKYHLYCSECRNQAFNKTVDNDPDFDVDTPFCPWCGAKMDREGV